MNMAHKVRNVTVRALQLDLAQPLETASASFSTWPVILVDLQTDQGVIGRSFVGCFLPMLVKPLVSLLQDMAQLIEGDPLCPVDLDQKIRKMCRLVGTTGPLATALAVIEIAAWDALAESAQVPLARLMGSAPRAFPIYKTLTAFDPGRVADLAQEAIEAGYGGVKCKIGHPNPANDMAVIKRLRKVCGDDFPIMGDFNQALSVPEAIQRIRPLDDLGMVWFEEPTTARDFVGHAQIARSCHTAISIGENWRSPEEAAESMRIGASSLAMPDLVNIGGVSAWMKTATLAEAAGVPISCHSYPEVCAHLLPAAASAHWLEHVDIFDVLFTNPVKPANGVWCASDRPGIGLEWDEAVVVRSLLA